MPDTALANRYDIQATRLIEMAQRTVDEYLALDFDQVRIFDRSRMEYLRPKAAKDGV